MNKRYVASCSFGKDSLAMVLRLIEEGWPLTEVIFYDTGVEFKAIYAIRDKMKPIFEKHGIKFVELKPDREFMYDLLERPVHSAQKGDHNGYGWCGGVSRWGTADKIRIVDKYTNGADVIYVGIASDEPERLARLFPPKQSPLELWGMTEADCLKYCYDRGFDWKENGVELYDILDRVSCWCCSNKNRKELKNIYQHLPEYWNRLEDVQMRLERPMKNFKNSKYGSYGNVLEMRKVFESEIKSSKEALPKTICELFAGVGGFRLGFERLNTGWETTWFSQWEPGASHQWAYDCYVRHFGDSDGPCTNVDISSIDKTDIPDHTLLVGGFPCQDYSVAHSLSTAKGIEGKKGVLWWQIRDTIAAKRPAFCLFENVDRLLRSPASQYGRDFGIMLSCFYELGYSVEWRVVRSAKYGAAQRRNRTFIFAYRDDTAYGGRMGLKSLGDIILSGFMATAFPISNVGRTITGSVSTDIKDVSDSFSFRFLTAGAMSKGRIATANITEKQEPVATLQSILQAGVDEKHYIPSKSIPKWEYLKGAKKIARRAKTGYEYIFSEGAMPFPDILDRPGRTMLTSEASVNRSSHVIKDPETGRLRVLTPVEAERLQGFDDNWTEGMPDRMRYFCMGNALIVPMITRMGRVLDKIIENEF